MHRAKHKKHLFYSNKLVCVTIGHFLELLARDPATRVTMLLRCCLLLLLLLLQLTNADLTAKELRFLKCVSRLRGEVDKEEYADYCYGEWCVGLLCSERKKIAFEC